MSWLTIVLFLAVVEAFAICFLLHVIGKIVTAQRERRKQIDPIKWEDWHND